jgi:hypothetical protein
VPIDNFEFFLEKIDFGVDGFEDFVGLSVKKGGQGALGAALWFVHNKIIGVKDIRRADAANEDD